MKGSTLHRSGLTREKMGVLASFVHKEKEQPNTKTQLNQYYKTTKAKELDLLWNGTQRAVQKMHYATKTSSQKSPAVYLAIGFVAGVLFMCCITLIVSIFSMNPRTNTDLDTKKVTVISEDANVASTSLSTTSEEKYVIKKGDTLNGIAYRFYGKYSEEKINQIQKINNITNPAAIRVGQELIIPVSQER